MQREHLGQLVKQSAGELGFTLCGITPSRPSARLTDYLAWIAAGMYGEMGYLARPDRVARRRDLNVILPGAQSLIVVGLSYYTTDPSDQMASEAARGRISNYAWGADYHSIMLARLERLAALLRRRASAEVATRAYVDTGAILERGHAQQAGLGFVGKNTLLIHPRLGSYLFLGVIVTTADLDPDPPTYMPTCGRCTRCLAACPTSAFPTPYVLDARRCISYLTIELKGWIPRDLRPLMGNWVYGCDICQIVCPWQRFAQATEEKAFFPIDDHDMVPPLRTLLAISEGEFGARYARSPLKRLGRERLVRNACIAAGNSGLPDLIDWLNPLLRDNSPLIRGHAAWALGRLGGAQAVLQAALASENDASVREEITAALY